MLAVSMMVLAHRLGADQLRFSELQGVSMCDGYVDARKIFDNIPNEPFEGGCDHFLRLFAGVGVYVRQNCGLICEYKPSVISPTGRNCLTKVLYPNGELADGWIKQRLDVNRCHNEVLAAMLETSPDCHRRHRDSCHQVADAVSCGGYVAMGCGRTFYSDSCHGPGGVVNRGCH